MGLQKFAMSMLTSKINRRVHTLKMKQAVLSAIKDYEAGLDWDRDELLAGVDAEWRRTPDGVLIIRRGEPMFDGTPAVHHWVFFIEIEDTNKLTEEKIADYVDLWWTFDASGDWGLGLIVTDRYGNPTMLDMMDMAWACIAVEKDIENEPYTPDPSQDPESAMMAQMRAAVEKLDSPSPTPTPL